MKKKYIETTGSDIDNKFIFSDINLSAGVWYLWDDEIDEEEPLRSDHAEYVHTDHSENN